MMVAVMKKLALAPSPAPERVYEKVNGVHSNTDVDEAAKMTALPIYEKTEDLSVSARAANWVTKWFERIIAIAALAFIGIALEKLFS